MNLRPTHILSLSQEDDESELLLSPPVLELVRTTTEGHNGGGLTLRSRGPIILGRSSSILGAVGRGLGDEWVVKVGNRRSMFGDEDTGV